MKRSMKRAFSLVELLVALIAISCIIAAFAPVMTKRMKNSIGVKSKNDQNFKLYLVSTPGGTYNSSNNNYTFTFKVPQGVTKINVAAVGAGSGGAGGTLGTEETQEVYTQYSYGTEHTLTFNKDMFDFKIKSLISAGGGGGAGYYNTTPVYGPPTSQKDCDPYHATYSDGICISDLMNSTNGPSSYEPPYHSGDTNNYWGYLCGNVPSSSSTSATTPVCQFKAAQDGCANIYPYGDWRLPVVSDLSKINALQYGVKSLGFCTQDHPRYGGCESGNTTLTNYILTLSAKYVPYYFWFNGSPQFGYFSSDSSGKLSVVAQGEFPTSSPDAGSDYNPYNAYSAFCVTERVEKSPSIGGGGGAYGNVISNLSLNVENLCDTISTIKYKAGSIGKGATYSSTSSTNAVTGDSSYIKFEGTKNDTPCTYQVLAYGGTPGANATSSGGGAGGQHNKINYSSSNCQSILTTGNIRYPNVSFEYFSCNTQSYYHGENGTDFSGGWGGVSGNSTRTSDPDNSSCVRYNSWQYGCPGVSSHNNGSLGMMFGGGGGGGYGKGDGGNGGPGFVDFTYKIRKNGAAGGGGGSGGLIHVKQISVTPGQTCTVKVGKGGLGGAVGSNGVGLNGGNGGQSSITCGNVTVNAGIFIGGKAGTAQSVPNETDAQAYTRQGTGSSGGYSTYVVLPSGTYSDANSKVVNKEADVIKSIQPQGLNPYAIKNSLYYLPPGSSRSFDRATIEVSTQNAIGGNGAPSPMDSTKFACGGLNQDSGDVPCNNSDVAGEENRRFRNPDIIGDTDYGYAGAGGAGGGWKKDGNKAGKGSDGQHGYVYVYWDKPN